jgi:hypothetical protein
MSSANSAQPSPFQRLVTELSVWWRVISRRTDGQEYAWVTIHDSEPRVGPAPPRPDKRTGKTLPSGILEGHDWSISPDYWDSSRPYRACIPVDLEAHEKFPEGKWVSAPFTLGRDFGVSDTSGWTLTPAARKFIFITRERVRPIVEAIISFYKQGYTLPPYLSLNWLNHSFPSEEALAAQIAEARRCMLDQYGFIILSLLQDPDWRKRPALTSLIGEITDIGLVGRRYRGTIVEFDKIDPSHLRTLLAKCIPIHYQWFSTSTGPFDPNELGAVDYHSGIILRPQTSLACAPRKGKEREASPKRPAGPSQKKRARYIAVQKKGEEDKGRLISKNEYKRLSEWCTVVHKQLPERDIFYAYEYEANDEDDAAPAGPVVSAKDLAAHEARMIALPREEPSTCPDTVVAPTVVTQGATTAEPEISSAVVTQGVTTPGPVNDEPAPVIVTAPIAKAIEVPVVPMPVPDNGAESPVSLGEEEAPFTPRSPIAPCVMQDDHISPMDRFTVRFINLLLDFHSRHLKQKSSRLPSPQAMPRPSSPPVSRSFLSEPAGRLAVCSTTILLSTFTDIYQRKHQLRSRRRGTGNLYMNP